MVVTAFGSIASGPDDRRLDQPTPPPVSQAKTVPATFSNGQKIPRPSSILPNIQCYENIVSKRGVDIIWRIDWACVSHQVIVKIDTGLCRIAEQALAWL